MKKLFAFVFIAIVCLPFSGNAAEETCYRISRDGQVWNRTPELLCVTPEKPRSRKVEISLRSGLLEQAETVAVFNLTLLSSARCMDCNQNVYGASVAPHSAFSALLIRFDGQRDLESGSEEGTLQIGSTRFYYRK